jgi:hypothetical protein
MQVIGVFTGSLGNIGSLENLNTDEHGFNGFIQFEDRVIGSSEKQNLTTDKHE